MGYLPATVKYELFDDDDVVKVDVHNEIRHGNNAANHLVLFLLSSVYFSHCIVEP